MANPLQTAGNDVPEKHIVWLCDQTLRALVLMGCAKHGGKEASVCWMLMLSQFQREGWEQFISCLSRVEQGLRLKAWMTGTTGEGTAGMSSLHTGKGLPAPVLGHSCQDGHIPSFWRTVFASSKKTSTRDSHCHTYAGAGPLRSVSRSQIAYLRDSRC